MKILNLVYQRLDKLFNDPDLQRMGRSILPYRFWIICFVHILLFSISYTYSILVLSYGVLDEETIQLISHTIFPLLVIRVAVYWYYDLYQGLWRYVSFQDLLNILRATLISSLVFTLLGVAWKSMQIPESAYILDFCFCTILVGGIRFVMRNIRENSIFAHPHEKNELIILVGPIDAVEPLVKDILGDPHCHYYPLAIVDPTKHYENSVVRVSDVPILSLREIKSGKMKLRPIRAIVLCWPSASRKQLDRIVDEMQFLNTPFKTVPRIEEIISGHISISDLRDVELEDLLERAPVQIEMEKISGFLRNKAVLVTGGGGSIGSELCRQIAAFKPKRLVVVERSENNLHYLALELRRSFPGIHLRASVSSVNDSPGLIALFRRERVDVVFHTAAYKHVPLMESAPVESAYNNILGTFNVAQAALETGVERFVMVSTDKAVNPTNVMGVTKRIAEMVVQSLNNGSETRFMTVRFGNVLGSAGSVIPLFKRQIRRGEPVTVTHPDIERFFMTIPEAVQLILQAGHMGKGGEIFVLDMGEPVKILKLAEKLIALSGKRPYEDVEIVYTGLRPGEKMYEELFNEGETYRKTSHPRIVVAECESMDKNSLTSHINEIYQLVINHDEEALRSKFKELVPGYQFLPLADPRRLRVMN